MLNLKKRLNTNYPEEGTVVPFRAGFDESADLRECLTFFRTRQIALDVSDAREGELGHVRKCSACSARLRGFQRDLGTIPDDVLHHELQDVVDEFEEPSHSEHHIIDLVEMVGRTLFMAFKARPAGDRDKESAISWHRTNDLLHVLGYAKAQAGAHIAALFRACEAALGHAAATHAIASASPDDVRALSEALEAGIGAVRGSTALLHEYGKLVAHIIVEGPPVVRHSLLWSVWNLFEAGHEARHVASAVLERIVKSRHGGEVTATAALIWQLHSNGREQNHCASTELPLLIRRLDQMIRILAQLFTRERCEQRLHDRLDAMLTHTFDGQSTRSQILGLIVARTATRNALHTAAARGVSPEIVQNCISALLFRHTANRAARPVLIDSELAASVYDAFPTAYVHALIDLLQPHGRTALHTYPHDRQGIVMSAIKVYVRSSAVTSAPAARFVHESGRWTFKAAAKSSIDPLFHELAAIATTDPSYVFHLEWANARFATGKVRSGKSKRTRHGRSKHAGAHVHDAINACL